MSNEDQSKFVFDSQNKYTKEGNDLAPEAGTFEGGFDPQNKYTPLAKWIKQLMEGISVQSESNTSRGDVSQFFCKLSPSFLPAAP